MSEWLRTLLGWKQPNEIPKIDLKIERNLSSIEEFFIAITLMLSILKDNKTFTLTNYTNYTARKNCYTNVQTGILIVSDYKSPLSFSSDDDDNDYIYDLFRLGNYVFKNQEHAIYAAFVEALSKIELDDEITIELCKVLMQFISGYDIGTCLQFIDYTMIDHMESRFSALWDQLVPIVEVNMKLKLERI